MAGLYPTRSISFVSEDVKCHCIRAFSWNLARKGRLTRSRSAFAERATRTLSNSPCWLDGCALQTQLPKFGAVEGGNYCEYRRTALTAGKATRRTRTRPRPGAGAGHVGRFKRR
ncbi:hypothetical protein MPTK1_4g05280 [Marchantia polymorpha subsp. ruderalis]|uniref:Uncharacterized protein n=2 Tax=Marchantia polymorpha TaxID=3197 RepID=A0AAF6B6K9_MARPO|nr:hypothetical protein MARPO_0087s0061 [Marchantia polymorpha]BBN07643.1 hypothetical protein Mp_4g05280 [Marchantia polymorpha subsp. ruderalis]|eukprot:PTQ33628.1 hypothetical protein MARPO_0087s0061 [Marchantia polymorpha]